MPDPLIETFNWDNFAKALLLPSPLLLEGELMGDIFDTEADPPLIDIPANRFNRSRLKLPPLLPFPESLLCDDLEIETDLGKLFPVAP